MRTFKIFFSYWFLIYFWCGQRTYFVWFETFNCIETCFMAKWFIWQSSCVRVKMVRIMQLSGGVSYECQLGGVVDGTGQDFCILTNVLTTCSFNYWGRSVEIFNYNYGFSYFSFQFGYYWSIGFVFHFNFAHRVKECCSKPITLKLYHASEFWGAYENPDYWAPLPGFLIHWVWKDLHSSQFPGDADADAA